MDEGWERLLTTEQWKSIPGHLWTWFFTAQVPLSGLIGVPALYLALVNSRKVVITAGKAGHFMTQLAAFLLLLPANAYELFFTDSVLDPPFPFWFSSFWRGFLRGVANFFDRSLEELDTDEATLYAFAEVIESLLPQWVLDRIEDDESDDGVRPPFQGVAVTRSQRTGRTPNSFAGELFLWIPYVRRTIPVLFSAGVAVLLTYVICRLVDDDGVCGTSTICGGPNGKGEYQCLWNNDALGEASALGKKPLRYRFFHDGTRMQFPDR
ncbi:hypothetical protein F5Y12DRAFT_717500 [Xylaria sp. FL1777]|nr:hypothetical protein F5Y12DRAFT_717500 [Xylaria sp. FL1777]